MTIAVIIPVLNEARGIGQTLSHTATLGFDDLIIVDGGSSDQTCAVVESRAGHLSNRPSPASPPIRLLKAPAGRARQLNAGAAASQCEALLFLHADTQLPSNARQAIATALSDKACVGGRFDVRFDSPRPIARLVGRMMNLRSRWSGIATGDQALFVRRDIFERIGRFAEIPLMEDIEFSRRLKRAGRLAPAASSSGHRLPSVGTERPGPHNSVDVDPPLPVLDRSQPLSTSTFLPQCEINP
jgi:rSAM/selenodomain-associated transferase 2